MGTKIEWATKVWNPITGCTKGCKYCYAEVFAKRLQKNPNPKVSEKYRDGFKPTFHPDSLAEPLFWDKPQRVFVGSMGDLFDPAFDYDTFELVMKEMYYNSKHSFLLLTKNPEQMLSYTRKWCVKKYCNTLPPNIWCGVTVTNQDDSDRLIPILLDVPAWILFVSIEPMVGPVILRQLSDDHYYNFLSGDYDCAGQNEPIEISKLDWVIVGGMTGPDSRPLHPGWVRCLRDVCKHHNVPFFFKGFGDWGTSDQEERKLPAKRWKWVDFVNGDLCNGMDRFPEKNETHHHELMVKVGRKLAGRLLDGKEYNELPNNLDSL